MNMSLHVPNLCPPPTPCTCFWCFLGPGMPPHLGWNSTAHTQRCSPSLNIFYSRSLQEKSRFGNFHFSVLHFREGLFSVSWFIFWWGGRDFKDNSLEDSLKICFLLWAYVWYFSPLFSSVQFSHVRLWDPMDCSMPGLPVHHQLPEFTQTHVHWASDAIQPSYSLSSPSPPVFNLSQHQGLFQWVSSLHQVAKVLEFQLQHPSFQWIFRIDFLSDGLVPPVSFVYLMHFRILNSELEVFWGESTKNPFSVSFAVFFMQWKMRT